MLDVVEGKIEPENDDKKFRQFISEVMLQASLPYKNQKIPVRYLAKEPTVNEEQQLALRKKKRKAQRKARRLTRKFKNSRR